MTTAIIVIDADESHDVSGVENAINGLVQRAENSGKLFFYVLPEGEPLADSVEKPTVSSILRYDPDDADFYDSARVDGTLTNRGVDNVVYIGATASKENTLVSKEQERGRSVQDGRNANPNA